MQCFRRERYDLGTPDRICMICANQLITDKEKNFGLCSHHRSHIVRTPDQVRRDFGRGEEIQLLRHSDELDEVIERLENLDLIDCNCRNERSDLIHCRYIAGIFLHQLQQYVNLALFDYITYADSGFINMDIIFTEMGYMLEDQELRNKFLLDPLGEGMEKKGVLDSAKGGRVLLLDLYRGTATRQAIDRLRLVGAAAVTAVYLTSFS